MKGAPFLWWMGLIVLLAGCASPKLPGGGAEPAGAAVELSVPYRHTGAGFGGTGLSDVAVVPPGRHPTYIAMLGLQKALARFMAQLQSPDLLSLKDSDREVSWQSDIGLLSAAQLAAYQDSPTRPALSHRLYGVRFSGRLIVVDNELRFHVKTQMSGRGAGDGWNPLPETGFDGAYFAGMLAQELKQNLLDTKRVAP